MTLHRQTFGHSGPVAPKRMSFILTGRTTLSEHLPTEIVDVPVIVAQRSPYLRKAIVQQALDDLTEQPIRLPDIDPMGFRMYIDWVKNGRVEFHTPTSTITGTGLLLRDSFDLIFAHIAGTQLEESDFQDYIIDELSKLLDASQTPDLKVLEVVFLEKGASNVLKQFVIDRMFAVERKMLSMMRGFAAGSEAVRGCEHHVHEEGECYRNRVMAKQAYSKSFASYSQDGFNARELSVHNGSEHLQAPTPTLPYGAKSRNAAFYDMAGTSCFGSAEWSREVHGLGRHTDKPLPVIPPLTPGTSPSPPSSPCSLRSGLSQGRNAHASTQQLISECLARLPHSPAPASKRSDPHESTVPVLILECLERFKRNNMEKEPSSESEGSPPQQSYASPGSSSPVRSPTRRALRSVSPSQRQVRWQPSYDELPRLNLRQFRAEASAHQSIPSHHLSSDHSDPPVSSPSSPTLPQSIPRKPAPHRGSDWLTQYNLINTLGTAPQPTIVTAKRSKKSRFVEIFRSDSLISMGRDVDLEREGSVVRVRSAMR